MIPPELAALRFMSCARARAENLPVLEPRSDFPDPCRPTELEMSLETELLLMRQVLVEFDDAESFREEESCESCEGLRVTVQELRRRWLNRKPGMQAPWRRESERDDEKASLDSEALRLAFCLCWISAICCV